MSAAEGIPCTGLDDAFRAEALRKSSLLVEGELLEAQGQFDAAAEKFATAAAIDERLGARCRELGLREQAWTRRRNAIGCWARAGNFYTAEQLSHALLAEPDLPELLRRPVQAIVDAIQAQRRKYFERRAAEAKARVPA